jgi:hypothetical protein
VSAEEHGHAALAADARFSNLLATVACVVTSAQLRPIERRMTRMADAGVSPDETGRRFHRSGQYVEQVLRLARVPRASDGDPNPVEMSLRPIERRLLHWRDQGVEPNEVAAMFKRSPEHIERVLALVDYKQRRGA